MATPFQLDPTMTTTVRKQFIANTRARMAAVRDDVVKFVMDGGLDKGAYAGLSLPEKVRLFRDRVQKKFEANVLGFRGGKEPAIPYTQAFTDLAYRRGLLNAKSQLDKLMKGSDEYVKLTQNQFLKQMRINPTYKERSATIAQEGYEDLIVIVDEVEQQLITLLVDGLSSGITQTELASNLGRAINKASRTRAEAMARTTTIEAHSHGQLDAFQEAGIEEVQLEVEFTTASGACPECEGYAGNIYSIKEAYGIIPVHPNCRCSWRIVIVRATRSAPRPAEHEQFLSV